VLVLGAAACTKSEGELKQDDRARIELIVADDVRASKAMADADTAARKGDVPGAIEVIDTRAKPAIESGLRAVANADPKTEWGRGKRNLFAKILEDRRAEIGPYTEAVKSGDAEKLIDVIETQAKIERRAITAIADLNEGR
jgi:hypothetical protein